MKSKNVKNVIRTQIQYYKLLYYTIIITRELFRINITVKRNLLAVLSCIGYNYNNNIYTLNVFLMKTFTLTNAKRHLRRKHYLTRMTK